MPKLEYPRHEQFCQCMALGHFSSAECYTNAGYPLDREAARELTKTDRIAERIREIEMDNAQTR